MPKNCSDTSSNLLIRWHIHRTSYDINIRALPPFQPTLPIASLEDVYTRAMQGCLVKIAQGFGESPSVSATFTTQDVRLDWVISDTGSALNYSMLLEVFKELWNLNAREVSSPVLILVGKDLNFTITDRTNELSMGEGMIVGIREADSEILAKRSVDPSPAPELLQPLASQQPSNTTSLSSKYVHSRLLFPCYLPILHKLTFTPLSQHYRPRSSI